MRMPNSDQSLTPTEYVGRGLIPYSTIAAQWAISQPHQMEVSTQGDVSSKKSGNHPGLCPTKGQKPNSGTPTRPISIHEPVAGNCQGSAIVSEADPSARD